METIYFKKYILKCELNVVFRHLIALDENVL